ncbi:MAG: ABC transporter permease [Lutimonas sp.]
MKTWWIYLKEEALLVVEDKSILLTCLIAPLFYAFFVGSIYKNKEVLEIPLIVVDMDHSSTSHKLSTTLDAHPKIWLKHKLSNMREAKELFYNLDGQGILMIPKGFERDMLRLESNELPLYLNNTKFLPSNELNKAIQQIGLGLSVGVKIKYFMAKGQTEQTAFQKSLPIIPNVISVYNATNNYGDYLLPILLILIIQQTLIIGFGQSVIHSLKEHPDPGLLTAGPQTILTLIFSKTSYYFLLYAAYFFVFYTLIFPYYNLNFEGAITLHFLSTFLYLTGVLLATILLASYFQSTIGWTEIMAFSTYPLFLISGYSWPLESMPKTLQYVAKVLPSTPFFEGFRKLSVQGASAFHIKNELIHMTFLVLLLFALLYLRLNHMSKKAQIKAQGPLLDSRP